MTIQASWKTKAWHPDRLRDGLQKLAASLGMEIKMRCTEPHRRQRFAILMTKEAHAVESVLDACRAGNLRAEPALAISNRRDLEGIARKHGLPFRQVDWNDRTKA